MKAPMMNSASLDRRVFGQVQLSVELAPARFVSIEDFPGVRGHLGSDRSWNNNNAVSVRHHHVTDGDAGLAIVDVGEARARTIDRGIEAVKLEAACGSAGSASAWPPRAWTLAWSTARTTSST